MEQAKTGILITEHFSFIGRAIVFTTLKNHIFANLRVFILSLLCKRLLSSGADSNMRRVSWLRK